MKSPCLSCIPSPSRYHAITTTNKGYCRRVGSCFYMPGTAVRLIDRTTIISIDLLLSGHMLAFVVHSQRTYLGYPDERKWKQDPAASGDCHSQPSDPFPLRPEIQIG